MPAAVRERRRDQALDGREIAAGEREAQARRVEHVAVALHLELVGALLEVARAGAVPRVLARERADEQRARAAHAGRLGVLEDRLAGARFEVADPLPAARQLLDLDEHGEPVDAVVRRQRARDLVVAAGQAARLAEVAEPDAARYRGVVDVGHVVGVADLMHELEAAFLEGAPEVLLARDPGP